MQKHYATILIRTLILLAAGLSGCDQPAAELRLEGATMGTTYTVQIPECNECGSLGLQIDARLSQLVKHLSHYDPESELSAFNNYHGTDWFPVSPELGTVIEFGLSVSEQSQGAFDISIAPAVDAWGFGPTEETQGVPAAQQLESAHLHSGYTKLAIRSSPRAIRKEDPLLRLDLSALAKGYAVDQLTYLLDVRGIGNYLVEIGGEIRTAGLREDGKPWRIGIQPPTDGLDLEFVVEPGDAAVATSGDYRNFYMLDDRRISHTIDPANALPVDNGVMSVSVIAPDAMQADALATALMVMGPEKATRFAQQHDIAMLLLARSGSDVSPVVSAAFAPYLLTN
jgi:thiamine biosynthesis lipoprotein